MLKRRQVQSLSKLLGDEMTATVVKAFQHIRSDGTSDDALQHHSGVDKTTFKKWEKRLCSPRIDLFEAVLNAAGYQLLIVRKPK